MRRADVGAPPFGAEERTERRQDNPSSGGSGPCTLTGIKRALRFLLAVLRLRSPSWPWRLLRMPCGRSFRTSLAWPLFLSLWQAFSALASFSARIWAAVLGLAAGSAGGGARFPGPENVELAGDGWDGGAPGAPWHVSPSHSAARGGRLVQARAFRGADTRVVVVKLGVGVLPHQTGRSREEHIRTRRIRPQQTHRRKRTQRRATIIHTHILSIRNQEHTPRRPAHRTATHAFLLPLIDVLRIHRFAFSSRAIRTSSSACAVKPTGLMKNTREPSSDIDGSDRSKPRRLHDLRILRAFVRGIARCRRRPVTVIIEPAVADRDPVNTPRLGVIAKHLSGGARARVISRQFAHG